MTVTLWQLSLYAGALLVLFLTPGPVWVALIARTMSGGFHAAWPLALGVAVGDVIWPLAAILGVGLLASVYGDFLEILRWAAAVIFLAMGVLLFRHADRNLSTNSTLTWPGIAAGLVAGLLVILGNPKAILFYMGILPGFFDIASLTVQDVAIICLLSAIMPMLGNLILAVFVHKARALVASAGAVARMNRVAGMLLIGVGIAIFVL